MPQITLPMLSKWACLFSAKGRARFLDVFKIYADGSFEKYPYGSICLDVPLILLDPENADSNRMRPSNIAQACDLFPDPACYRFLRMIEDDIIEKALHRAINPIFYVIAGMDDQYFPTAIVGLDYGEALAQLRTIGTPALHP